MTPRINRAGMGTLGDPLDPYGPGGLYDPNAGPLYDGSQYPNSSLPTYSTQPIQSSAPPWWAVLGPSIITTAGKDIQAVFGNQYQQQSIPRTIYAGSGYTDQYGNVIPRTAASPGVGFGFDSQGIRLSDGSHIGWFPIVGVIGIIFLLQSPGFTRRGR